LIDSYKHWNVNLAVLLEKLITGIVEYGEGNIVISNQLSVSGNRLQIYTITGKLVQEIPVSDHRLQVTETKWHAQGHPAGVYMVRVKAGNNVVVKKIVKQ